jgi:hypothetical protein
LMIIRPDWKILPDLNDDASSIFFFSKDLFVIRPEEFPRRDSERIHWIAQGHP